MEIGVLYNSGCATNGSYRSLYLIYYTRKPLGTHTGLDQLTLSALAWRWECGKNLVAAATELYYQNIAFSIHASTTTAYAESIDSIGCSRFKWDYTVDSHGRDERLGVEPPKISVESPHFLVKNLAVTRVLHVDQSY